MVIEPAWSPDGSSIALEGGEDAVAFWVVGRSGEPRQVVPGRGGGHLRNGPVWSPDGRSIAGVARLPEGTAIGIWPVDGSTDGTYLPAEDAHGVDWWGSAG